jgi:hypothetical protein
VDIALANLCLDAGVPLILPRNDCLSRTRWPLQAAIGASYLAEAEGQGRVLLVGSRHEGFERRKPPGSMP